MMDFSAITPEMLNTLAADWNPMPMLEQLNTPANAVLGGQNPMPAADGGYFNMLNGGLGQGAPITPQGPAQPGMTPLNMQQIAALQGSMAKPQQMPNPAAVSPSNNSRAISTVPIPGVNSPGIAPGLNQILQGGKR